ncbi:hypothetical protein HK405_014208 [Cladochytrium tenue]|nr:hypothetical protein HK405_014208 [Cladochytrium tenue]
MQDVPHNDPGRALQNGAQIGPAHNDKPVALGCLMPKFPGQTDDVKTLRSQRRRRKRKNGHDALVRSLRSDQVHVPPDAAGEFVSANARLEPPRLCLFQQNMPAKLADAKPSKVLVIATYPAQQPAATVTNGFVVFW